VPDVDLLHFDSRFSIEHVGGKTFRITNEEDNAAFGLDDLNHESRGGGGFFGEGLGRRRNIEEPKSQIKFVEVKLKAINGEKKAEMKHIKGFRSSDHDPQKLDMIRKGECILLKNGSMTNKYEDLTTAQLDPSVQQLKLTTSSFGKSYIGVGRIFHEGEYTKEDEDRVGLRFRGMGRSKSIIEFIAEQRSKKIILRFKLFAEIEQLQLNQEHQIASTDSLLIESVFERISPRCTFLPTEDYTECPFDHDQANLLDFR